LKDGKLYVEATFKNMVKTHFVSLNANQVTTIDNQSWISIQACDASMQKNI
jgi:hypothetical protein